MKALSAIRILLCLAVFSLRVTAQTDGTIYGTLISANTGQPIKGNLNVNVAGFGSFATNSYSDDRGNYSVQVPAGTYRLTASCSECSGQAYGSRTPGSTGKLIPVKAGERVRIDFRMFSPSVITGRVVDEDGDALSRVIVETYRERYGSRGDKVELLGGFSAITDDRGEYRLRVNSGGEYVIGIRERLGYPALFYPDTIDPNTAQMISVQPGAEVSSIDFKRRRIPGYSVRGQIPPLGTSNRFADIVLQRSGHIVAGPFVRQAVNVDGTFEIRNVPPGAYELTATNGPGPSEVTAIQVGASDVNDLRVVLPLRVTLSGRITQNAPPGQNPATTSIGVRLDHVGGQGGGQATVGSDGLFAFTTLSPGIYRMSFYGLGARYVESATLGSQNALGDFAVTGAEDPLVVVLGYGSSRVEATIRDAAGIPYSGAFAALIAEGPRRGRVDSTYSGGADSDGRIILSGVAPGRYELFAWDEQPRVYAGDLFNREYLKRFDGRGTPVQVEANKTIQIQTEIIIGP